jgi:hypothetical protein
MYEALHSIPSTINQEKVDLIFIVFSVDGFVDSKGE